MDGQKCTYNQVIKQVNSQALKKYKARKRKQSLRKQARDISLAILEHQDKYGEYII
jgi:hypothetical protein